MAEPRSGATYYDRPVLKEPVWIWAVPAYFYVGGVAGAAATLGAVTALSRDDDLEVLARRCRALAAGGTVAGSALLVYDLGRPERFLNMLRVFRPSSPLNVGSWILAAATGSAVLAALTGAHRGLPARAARAASGVLGVPLAGYTGVLLATTAVPVWQEAGPALPALFVASAVGGAASALELMPAGPAERRVVRTFGALGRVAELAAAAWTERRAAHTERVARPKEATPRSSRRLGGFLHEGAPGAMLRAARLATAAALGASLLGGRSRGARVAAGLLGSAGALAVKFGVFYAGRPSTMDPRATFEPQRP
jgi:DMSO reductase anchor subunit